MTMPKPEGALFKPRIQTFMIATQIRKAIASDAYSLKEVLIARKIIANHAQAIMKAKT